MPLHVKDQNLVLEYCDRDLPSRSWFETEFDFIEDDQLREKLISEFYSARYIYKLGEALAVKDQKLGAHIKFQIVQYASIYEAIIVYLLWRKFSSHEAVVEMEYHDALRLTTQLSRSLSLVTSDGGEPVYFCVQRKEKTSAFSIKFDDKVDAAVKIGFVKEDIAEDIKVFYKLRNAIHLETAVKKEIEYEIGQSLLAYRRMRPFIDGVKEFLGSIKDEQARPAEPEGFEDD